MKPKLYKIFEPADKVITKERDRIERTTKKPKTLQETANDIIEAYPKLIKRISELDK